MYSYIWIWEFPYIIPERGRPYLRTRARLGAVPRRIFCFGGARPSAPDGAGGGAHTETSTTLGPGSGAIRQQPVFQEDCPSAAGESGCSSVLARESVYTSRATLSTTPSHGTFCERIPSYYDRYMTSAFNSVSGVHSARACAVFLFDRWDQRARQRP